MLRLLRTVMLIGIGTGLLSGCTELSTMLASGTKNYCKNNPGAPCTRPAPNQPVLTPTR